MTPDTPGDLLRDTLAFLKDPLLPKQTLFANLEECVFFKRKPEAKRVDRVELPEPPLPVVKLAPQRPIPAVQKEPTVIPSPLQKQAAAPEPAPLSPMKKTLQRVAPHLKLSDEIPDDTEAKRIASAWKEKISDAQVVLLACDTQGDTLELLKGLAKAIDQNLAKSKVIAAERLEKEKRWDLFLEKNPLRLIIASDGIQQMPDLMRYYKAVPAQGKFSLGQTPLLVLSAVSIYKSIEHKALLWKTLCQMLKK